MSLRGRHAGAGSIAPTVRFLVVSAGGTYLALHADRIQGLLTIEEAGAAGVLTVQGLVYSYVDLAGRLHRSVDPEGPDMRVILFSKGSTRGNIRVAKVHGLKELEQSQVLSLPGQFRGEEQRWYQGMILFEDSVALVLNPAWVLEACGPASAVGVEQRQDGRSRIPVSRPVLIGGQSEAC